jgi:ATP-binding protein involved in chromosome partitioning
MGIWDYMHKAGKVSAPVSIEKAAGGALSIRWDDGVTTATNARDLRLGCPCALCVDEMTGKRTLDPATVPQDVAIREMTPVGNYAIRVVFSDAHETGLFDWPLLRQLSK